MFPFQSIFSLQPVTCWSPAHND